MTPQIAIPRIYRLTLWMLLATLVLMVAVVWRILWPTVDVSVREPLAVYGPTTVAAGDPVEFVVDYCAHGEAFGWVGGIFASNGVMIPVAGVWPASLPDGCHVMHLRLDTPRSLAPGSYRFYMVRHYQPTMVASVQRHVMSEPFTVAAVRDK